MTVLATLALAFTLATPPGRTTDDLLGLVNQYRLDHGLQALRIDSALTAAAQAHADYMSLNRTLTHNEKADHPGFKGEDLQQRVGRVGWTDECSELVGFATLGTAASVQAIFDSPCHRSRFLKPGSLLLGVGENSGFVCLLIGGEPVKGTVVSPADGETNVPTTWKAAANLAGTSNGPGFRLLGYPLVFTDTTVGENPLTVKSAKLLETNGPIVSTILRDPTNDPHYTSSLALIPVAPLKANTEYTVEIAVRLSQGQTVERTWRFTTGSR